MKSPLASLLAVMGARMSVEHILWAQDATALADLVRKGEVSVVELTDAAIARAEATRPDINATAEPLYDAARARAKTVDRSLPLAGVPFAIKDLGIAIKGVPTHGGSRIPAWLADVNSVLTDRFLAAGLIPIVTSTSPEHGLRLMTESKPSASPAIPGTPATPAAARRVVRRPWSLPAWCRWRMPPMAAARSACLPPAPDLSA